MSKSQFKFEKDLCVLVFPTHIVAYSAEPKQSWLNEKIKGNEVFEHHHSSDYLNEALVDLNSKFNFKDDFAKVKLSIIYTPEAMHLISDSIKDMLNLKCQYWQILNWNSIYQFSLQILNAQSHIFDFNCIDHEWLQENLLPVIWHANSVEHYQAALTSLRDEKKRVQEQLQMLRSNEEHALAIQLQQLEQDKEHLQQQIRDAKLQLQALQQPDLESLLCFLPAIFKDFFNVVRPDELALLCGVINAPSIASPYHSPSLSTVQQKKRQFLASSKESQNKILDLCRELVQNHNALQVHQEFKVLVGALD